jgi:glutamate/tyrosine decarboxylase-like PLP-dependent enzyme
MRPHLPEVDFDFDDATWRRIGERFLDLAIDVSTGWERKVPGPAVSPDETRARFSGDLPARGVDLADLIDRLAKDLPPLSSFNGHPSFYGYITSSPSPVGVLGSLVAAALNQNTALWRLAQGATTVELQAIDWIRSLVGFPPGSEGIFSSGGQLANTIAHAVARDRIVGWASVARWTHRASGSTRAIRATNATSSRWNYWDSAAMRSTSCRPTRRIGCVSTR